MFNFFQKKKKNRPNGHRDSKEESKKISSVFPLNSKDKKEDITETKKTINAPQNMIPHVSEKSSNLLALNSYVFKIGKNINKIITKNMIEKHYNVKVESVRILNTNRKKRIRGNIVGYKPGYKKAIIQLKEGHKIEL